MFLGHPPGEFTSIAEYVLVSLAWFAAWSRDFFTCERCMLIAAITIWGALAIDIIRHFWP